MSYLEWFTEHGQKHDEVVNKLNVEDIDALVNYFTYENMQKNEPDFCPLFKLGKKCHDVVELNCYTCGCPYFRFNDDGLSTSGTNKVISMCTKGLGDQLISNNLVHQDCSGCVIPHSARVVRQWVRKYGYSWFDIMKKVINKN